MPVEREDLSMDTQAILDVYDKLQSKWDSFGGHYLGKDLSTLPMLEKYCQLYDYEIQYALFLIPIIDNIVAEEVAKKIKRKTKSQEGNNIGRNN